VVLLFVETHVLDISTTEGINTLIVIAHCEDCTTASTADIDATGIVPRKQFEPSVLQGIGVLKLINQDVTETLLVMRANRFVMFEQFIAAQ